MANTNATIETNHGTIELELFSDDAPKTVAKGSTPQGADKAAIS